MARLHSGKFTQFCDNFVEFEDAPSHALHNAYNACDIFNLLTIITDFLLVYFARELFLNVDLFVQLIYMSRVEQNFDPVPVDLDLLSKCELGIITKLQKRWHLKEFLSVQKDRFYAKLDKRGISKKDRFSDWADGPVDWAYYKTLTELEKDKYLMSRFPPRTKSDVGIRNTRLEDIAYCFYSIDLGDVFETRLETLKGKSYIFAANIILYSFLTPDEWWHWFDELGVFALAEYHLRDFLKSITDQLKKKEFYESRRFVSMFIENHNLFGALQPPVEGWDPVEQTKNLASTEAIDHGFRGTVHHGLAFFAEKARTCLIHEPDRSKYKVATSLTDYITNYDWERSGSSSYGRVEWQYTDPENKDYDRKGSFKARKNFVLDVIEPAELAKRCLASPHTDNVALIKSELAKIRIAVSSPLELYLLESWLLQYTGHFYLHWEASTLEESPATEFKRNYGQWSRMNQQQYVLPYDFENFDHQISKSEIIAITNVVHFLVKVGLPDIELAEYLVIESIKNATLRDPPACGKRKYPVKNSLLSGGRLTTIIGNAFNLIAFSSCRDELVRLLGYDPFVEVEIRGDDLRVTSEDQIVLVILYYIYKAAGYRANPAKFGLCRGRGDFLRQDCVAKEGMVGLPARTCPSVLQRKPWKPSPWMPEGRLTNTVENLYNVMRRLPDTQKPRVEHFADSVCTRWASATKIQHEYLTIPKAAGGLGLRPWDKSTFISCKGNKIPVSILENLDIDVTIKSTTEHRSNKLKEMASKHGVTLTTNEINQFLRKQAIQKVASDDIPGLLPSIRWHYRRFIRGVRFRRYHAKKNLLRHCGVVCFDILESLRNLHPHEDSLTELAAVTHVPTVFRFKKHVRVQQAVRECLELGRLRRIPVMDSLVEFLYVRDDIRFVERKLKLKRHCALDWLLEGLTIDHAIQIHPFMISYLSMATAKCVVKLSSYIRAPEDFTILWNHMSGMVLEAFNESALKKTFFSN